MRIDLRVALVMLIAGGSAATGSVAAQEPTREQMLGQLSATLRGMIEPGFEEAYGFGGP